MEGTMRPARPISLLAPVALLISLFLCASASAQPTTRDRARTVVAGTVRSVDTRARTFDLLTGVGHALRVTRIGFPEGIAVRSRLADSATGSIGVLTAGCIVRLEGSG